MLSAIEFGVRRFVLNLTRILLTRTDIHLTRSLYQSRDREGALRLSWKKRSLTVAALMEPLYYARVY